MTERNGPLIQDPEQILALPLGDNDSGETTIRGYLIELIKVAWDEKRAFGNSGWHYDLYLPLVEAGLIPGKLDENGYLEDCDSAAGERMIFEAIDALKRPVTEPQDSL